VDSRGHFYNLSGLLSNPCHSHFIILKILKAVNHERRLISSAPGVPCGQLYAAAALPPEKEPPIPVGWEVGWAPEPV
jgi:hypothetical protein